MKIVYKLLDDKNDKGQWFEAYEVADDFPNLYGFAPIAPPEDMLFPKWDQGSLKWIEDKDSIIEALKTENAELVSRVEVSEGAILDLADMILSR